MKKALTYSFLLIAFSWTVYYGLTALWKDFFAQGGAPMMLLKSAYMLFPMLVALALWLYDRRSGRNIMTSPVEC